MLLMCVTGLPLIFHHEIDDLLHESIKGSEVLAGAPRASLDKVVANGVAREPGHVPQFLIWDDEDENALYVSLNKSIDGDASKNILVRVDANTAAFLDAPDLTARFTYLMFKLHTDMFAGLPGKLFLGLMGLLFCIALVSGVVLYAPSMRKLRFGAYRVERPRVVRWLDIHNLTGIVLLMWMFVVGATGVINTWADLMVKIWQFGQLAELTAEYKDRPTPIQLSSIEGAVKVALSAQPGMKPAFVVFPGTSFGSKSHYIVLLKGSSPLTSRLLKPALIDAKTGGLTAITDLPWYMATLLISQPLHFGDYGGMPLKIIWGILDLITIIVLVTGLYLWLRRSKAVHGTMLASSLSI